MKVVERIFEHRIWQQIEIEDGMVNVDLYSAIITKVSNVLNTIVSGEKPGFQALPKGKQA